MKSKKKLILVISVFILCSVFVSTTGLAAFDPGDGGGGPRPGDEIYSYKYKTLCGVHSGGSISDTRVLDDINCRWTCAWFWWLTWSFFGEVRLYFPYFTATELIIRYACGRGWMSSGTNRIIVYYYEGGDSTFIVENGYHELNLDSSKRVKYIDIGYMELGSAIAGDRYIWVDKIAIIKA